MKSQQNVSTRKMMKVCIAGGLCAISVLVQPALAQNRRAGDATQTRTGTTTESTSPADSQLGNYRNPQADQWIPLEESKRQAINADLQATVVELLELFHDAKQSHWNLRGPLYFPLHEALQEYADNFRNYADIFAERQLQIGLPADGRTSTIVQSANLPQFPGGPLSDRQVLALMTERMYTVGKRIRARVESTAKNGDEVTSNKLQDFSYVIDKQIWQFRVHMQ